MVSNNQYSPPDMAVDQSEEASMSYTPEDPSFQRSSAEQHRQAKLMAIDGVEGVGANQDAIGNPGIVVYVRDAEAAKRVPPIVDGLSVDVQITGPINALGR